MSDEEVILTAMFEPGCDLGLYFLYDSGVIQKVFRVGQAKEKGVRAGMRMMKIADAPYSKQLLDSCRKGTKKFKIDFVQANLTWGMWLDRKLGCFIRTNIDCKEPERQHVAAKRIQASWRRQTARKKDNERKNAATKIQNHFRTMRALRDAGQRVDEVQAEDADGNSEAGSIEGKWEGGCIIGTTLWWSNGLISTIDVLTSKKFTLTIKEGVVVAELENDGKLHWSDGDVWERMAEADNPKCGELDDENQGLLYRLIRGFEMSQEITDRHLRVALVFAFLVLLILLAIATWVVYQCYHRSNQPRVATLGEL